MTKEEIIDEFIRGCFFSRYYTTMREQRTGLDNTYSVISKRGKVVLSKSTTSSKFRLDFYGFKNVDPVIIHETAHIDEAQANELESVFQFTDGKAIRSVDSLISKPRNSRSGVFTKLFCLHKWNSHAKSDKEHEFFTHGLANRGEFIPTGIKKAFTREVLICEKCGKVKMIEY